MHSIHVWLNKTFLKNISRMFIANTCYPKGCNFYKADFFGDHISFGITHVLKKERLFPKNKHMAFAWNALQS